MKLRSKKRSLSLAVLGLTLFAWVWFLWEFGPFFGNRGCESGYYGQFNRVQHLIKAMPNVEIEKSWLHEDVTLEDFGFTLRVKGTEVQVVFWEGSPQMKERNKGNLWAFIETQINSNEAIHAIGTGGPQHDG